MDFFVETSLLAMVQLENMKHHCCYAMANITNVINTGKHMHVLAYTGVRDTKLRLRKFNKLGLCEVAGVDFSFNAGLTTFV